MLKLILLVVVALLVLMALAFVVSLRRAPIAMLYRRDRRALLNAGFKRSMVESPSGPQCVFESGSGPVLLLLHGAGDHAGTWAKVAQGFASGYHVIIADLAGHGESAPDSGPLHIQSILDGLDAILAAKSGGGPVIIAANSLGAWVGMYYAFHHPERVARLIATGGGAVRGERPDLVEIPRNREEMLRLFEATMDAATPRPAGFVLDDLARQLREGPVARLAAAGAAEMSQYLLDGQLAQMRVPVDLLWGESDQLVPLPVARRMMQELPACRLTTIPHAGHVPQQEHPKAYASALRQLLLAAPPLPTAKTQEEAQR